MAPISTLSKRFVSCRCILHHCIFTKLSCFNMPNISYVVLRRYRFFCNLYLKSTWKPFGLRGAILTSYWAVSVSRRKLCLKSSMFVLFCQFTFCLTKPICLLVQWTVFLVTIVISCICGFGNVCFVLSLCQMSVQPLFDHPFIGTVSNALGTVTLHFLLCVQTLCSC